MEIVINILILSGLVLGLAKLLPGIHLKDYKTAVIVAVVYSVFNFLLGWLLNLLALPLTIITLGLFGFVINAFLLWLTDKVIDDFKIDTLPTTLMAAFLITVGNYILRAILF